MADWEDFRAAFKRGDAFWDGKSSNGATVCIKMGDITGIVFCDEAWLEHEALEDEERKSRKLTEGE